MPQPAAAAAPSPLLQFNCNIEIDHSGAVTALDWSDIVDRAASATFAALPDYAQTIPEFSLLVCDDARIRELNSEFRAKDKPTNVLSFPQFEPFTVPEGEAYIGDIALSYDTLVREAEDGGLELASHAIHLIVHSILHLFGYDHLEDAEAEEMEALEAEILATLQIKNPYQ